LNIHVTTFSYTPSRRELGVRIQTQTTLGSKGKMQRNVEDGVNGRVDPNFQIAPKVLHQNNVIKHH
jgi:hypothetical protein